MAGRRATGVAGKVLISEAFFWMSAATEGVLWTYVDYSFLFSLKCIFSSSQDSALAAGEDLSYHPAHHALLQQASASVRGLAPSHAAPRVSSTEVQVLEDPGENPFNSPSQTWTVTNLTLESQYDSHNLFISRCIHPSIIYLHLFYYYHYTS